jgi:hypothetical protein
MTTPPADQGSAHTEGAPLEKTSLFEDFIDVFYAPSTVYDRRRNSSAWPYFWILSILSVVLTIASRSVYTAALDGDFGRQMTKVMAKNPQLTEQMVSQQRGVSEMFGMMAMYVGMPLLILIVGILSWIGARLVSAKLDFGRAMLVATIAQIPRLLGALFTAIYALLLSDTSGVNSMSRLTWSPARFMDPDTANPAMLGLLGRLDVFTIWVTILIGIGIAVVARVPRSKGYTAAAIVWGVPTLITAVGAIVGG